MVGGVTHGQHAVGQKREFLRTLKVFQEIFLHPGVATEIGGDARREETVAQPAGSLARRAVREDVHGILPERLSRRFENAVEPVVTTVKAGTVGLWIDQFPQMTVAHVTLAGQHGEFDVANRVRFQGFHRVITWFKLIEDGVHAPQPLEIHIVTGEDFIEGHE